MASCSAAVPHPKIIRVVQPSTTRGAHYWQRIELPKRGPTIYVDACATTSDRMVEVLIDPYQSESRDPEDDTVSIVETWEILCLKRVGALASVAGFSGRMGGGEYRGSGCMFPSEDDYRPHEEVSAICDFVESRTSPPAECSQKPPEN